MTTYLHLNAIRCRVLATLVCALVTPAAVRAACRGDCNGDNVVTVDELLLGVGAILETSSAEPCPALGAPVTVDQLLASLNAAVDGCPATDTPTPTPTVSPTSTPTRTPSSADLVPPTNATELVAWLRAGTYRGAGWTAESAPHRSGGPHGSIVRTYLNDIVFDSLAIGNAQHPSGAALVKELFGANNTVAGWAVEVKIQSDSAGGNGWYWYEGGSLSGVGLGICTGCHGNNFGPYVSKDFVLTPYPLQ